MRFLAAGFCWSVLLIASAAAQPAASLRPSQTAAPPADQAAIAALRGRPWYAAFKTVLADTNALGRDKFDPAFGEGWTETEALGEAVRRIEAGARDGRAATTGAINDAVDLGASNLVGRAGCFAALMQRADFAPQLAHLAALRINGQLPDAIRAAVKEFAQGPCEAPQSAGRNFDPRRGWEAGKRLLNNAVAAGALPTLAKYLDERGHLATVNADEQLRQTREGVAAEFRRFDRLYDGHAELLRSYQGLFADYCPTDQRFCALRDLVAQWGQPDGYCEQVVKYAAAYYMDTTRLGYLTGAENDGLNRAWEGYHLKFAPACIFLGKRPDLIPAAARRLDVIAPLFANDPNAPGDASIAPIRAALRTVQTNVETLAGHDARIKAYRAAASGGDTRVASINPAQTTTDAGPVLPDMPSDDALRALATAESERQLQLDRLMVRDIQERLLAIGSAVTLSGSMSQSTRAAIRSWQGAVGLEPTGFLTRAQIDLLKIRTQERWAQWRGGRNPVAEAPVPSRMRPARVERQYRQARPQRRYRSPDRDSGEIPGAIPAYSWRRF